MGHVKSFFSGAMLCAIWLILLQVLGNATSSEAAASVRLVNGSNSCSGKVQVLYLGQWLTVCNRSWGFLEANVVCRELGCGEAEVVAYSGQNFELPWIKRPNCLGNESSLLDCPMTLPESFTELLCLQNVYAGVICQYWTTRLVNGNSSCSGRVEVLYNGIWGTVSDDGWDLSDAAVVCREIGCGDAVEAKTAAYFGQGSGPVLMNLVDCFGNETTLKQCKLDRQEQNNLTHLQDAGVVCAPTKLLAREPPNPSPNRTTRLRPCMDEQDAGVVCEFTSTLGEGPDESPSGPVKMLLRIEVKTDSRTNPNDPIIMRKLSEEMKKLQISGHFKWRTQPDGKVFQKVPQKKDAPKTPCH